MRQTGCETWRAGPLTAQTLHDVAGSEREGRGERWWRFGYRDVAQAKEFNVGVFFA